MALHLKRFWAGALTLLLSGVLGAAQANDLVHLMRTPDGGIQPQAVMDQHGTLHLVYLKGDPAGCDVFYVKRPKNQRVFSQPIRVNSEPGSAIAIGTVRGAQLALGKNERVHVAWNGAQPARDPGAKGAPMLYARLDDSGKSFEPQRNLMTSTMNLDGGGSVAADGKGNVYVVWHAHPRTGIEDELHRVVYVARSRDEGRSFAPEHKVNDGETGVCACCGLKAFADSKGRLFVLYRAVNEHSSRDSQLLVSTDHGATFHSRLLGAWQSSICPMSTPALGKGPDKTIIAAWETQGQVYRGFVVPERLDERLSAAAADGGTGGRKHPVFALSEGKASRLLMAWTEGTGWNKGGSLAWECIDLKDGQKASGELPGVPVWGMAAAAPEADGTFTLIY
jgi:hypothetical protein